MESNPLVFMAKLENDTLRFHQVMKSPHSDHSYQEMESELETLNKMEAFDIVPRSKEDGRITLKLI